MAKYITAASPKRTFTRIAEHTLYLPALRAKPVVIDVGANHGRFSQLVSQVCGEAHQYLIEANPYLVSELRDAQSFPVLYCAVTDRDGQITLNLARNDTGSSVLELRAPNVAGPGCVLLEQVEVPARTLQGILDELPHSIFDIVKIDIEGAEVLALGNCGRDLLKRIGQITIEFHSHPMFGFDIGRQVKEIIVRMRGEGFIVLDFSFGAMMDVLMINKKVCGIGTAREWVWRTWLSIPRWLRPAAAFVPSSIRRWVANHVKPIPNDLS